MGGDHGPPRSRTIPELLDHAVNQQADAHAIEDEDVTLTFTELGRRAHRAARALVDLGITPGDRVAIWAPNMWEWVVAGLGIHLAGAVLVPINTRYKGTEAGYILDKSGAKALFTVDGFLGLDFLQMVGRPDLPTITFRKDWDAFLDRVPDDGSRARVEVTPDHLSDILFTSGTTGQPKGVMTTHEQSVRAYWSWSEVIGLRAGDRYLVVAPFFHCFGYKAGWLAALMRGATILPHAVFDAVQVLERIPRDRVSMLPGPPALYQSILQQDLTPHDLSSLRLAVTGAASIPVKLIHQMRDVLGFETVITGYGLTEATGIATMCRFDDDPETIAQTSGRAIPDVDVKVVGADGETVPAGEPGHVLVRGYNVMKGYFDDENEHGEDPHRRLAPDRRHRRDGRAGVLAHHGSHQGHVHRGWVQRLPGRDRAPAPRPPRDRRGRRDRRAPRPARRGGHGLRGQEGRPGRRRAHQLVPGATWPISRCPAGWPSWTRFRATRAAR